MESSTPTNCEARLHSLGAEDPLLGKMADLQDPVDFIENDSASHDQTSYLSAQGLGVSSCQYQDEHVLVEQKTLEGRTRGHHDQSAPLDVKQVKTLCKSSTFSCSVEVQACSKSIKGEHVSSGVEEQDRNIMESAAPAFARSMSLPASIKLVSAMKGGREQSGEPSKMNLHVKWGKEVYDPPCSSMSHTVRNHPQRRKARKKDKECHKHKQNKGKSSRGNSIEKKDKGQKLIGNLSGTIHARVQSTAERSLLDKCACSDVEVLDYAAVSGQESKCGSSFMRESLAKVRISLAGTS